MSQSSMKSRVGFAVLIGALFVCLAGCQQFGSWFGKPDPAAEARKEAAEREEHWTPTVTDGQKVGVQMAVARSFESDGQQDEAIRIYLDVLKKDGKRTDACCRLALLYAKKGDWKSSEQYYGLALKREPKSVELHCDLGYAYYLQARYKEAEAEFRQAIALKSDFSRAHNNLGLLMARTGREHDAIWEFSRAGCSEAEAHANLGLACTLENRWAEANDHYQFALSRDPNLAAAKAGLATLQALEPKFTPQNTLR
jgi:Tfp pilus assembly protein PilF